MKAGFAVLIGRSNVGKSTLLNALVGTKIAITTNKPQTTQDVIHGVVNTEEGQIIFVDTPGVFKGDHHAHSGNLLQKVKDALVGIDIILYVVDPTRAIGTEERFTLSLLREIDLPKILVINKMAGRVATHLAAYQALAEEDSFTHALEISALKGTNLKTLISLVLESLPESEPIYAAHQRTNLSREQWVAELIREKVLHATRAEVPYTIKVVVDSIEAKPATAKSPAMFVITARIITNADRYKKMLIGKGGRAIKEIGSNARKELEEALQSKIFLDLEVETNLHSF